MMPQHHDGPKHIVIIGGGIIGCTSAYYLTRHPAFDPLRHSITLLEATSIAAGASGKAGGLLALWAYPNCLVPLSYRLHGLLSEEHGGEERWGYRALRCGQVDCVGRAEVFEGGEGKDGGHGVSLKKRSKQAMGKLRAAGVLAEPDWLSPDTLRRYEEMGDPGTTAQVHPFQFTTAMAELAKDKGADIRVGAAVQRINYTADGLAVASVTYTDKSGGGAEHTLPATDIVLAAGPWTPTLYPAAPISATRAHSVTIQPARPVSAHALFTQITLPTRSGHTAAAYSRGAHSIATPEIYPRPHNEVYACGDADTLVPLPASADAVACDEQCCADIVHAVRSISDALRDGAVTATQACYLPGVDAAGSEGPLVGLTGVGGLVLAAGHACWGVQNGPATGMLVSEFVFEGGARSAGVADLDPRLVL